MNIVIIDDEILLSSSIEKKLRLQDYNVTVIHSFAEYKEFNFGGVDLVLLDLTLGDGDGFDILQELKSNPKTQDISILVMSGHGEIENKVKGLDLGADDYIVKPFLSEELIARVRANLRKGTDPSDNGDILKKGKVELNRVSRVVKIKGKEVNFSKKEKQILEFFMMNNKKLISKRKLADRFWKDKVSEEDDEINDNIINVTMYNLRKKIGDGAKLETKNGEGYIFSTGR